MSKENFSQALVVASAVEREITRKVKSESMRKIVRKLWEVRQALDAVRAVGILTEYEADLLNEAESKVRELQRKLVIV